MSWSAQDASPRQYELQQAFDETFSDPHVVYLGPDKATVISGLPNDRYFYRVRATDQGDWSERVQVDVKHHSLTRAISFFTLGAVMFIALMVVLVSGARKEDSL